MVKREQVLLLASNGLTTSRIAEELGISKTTVRYHREPKRRANVNKCTTNRRRQLKQKAVDYSGGKCLKCGYDICIAALTFHHINPNEKELSLGSGRFWEWEVLIVELNKTIILCNRCHTECHSGLWLVTPEMMNEQKEIRMRWPSG